MLIIDLCAQWTELMMQVDWNEGAAVERLSGSLCQSSCSPV